MATFRKNQKGEWVVFGTVSEVKPGKVLVEKRGGQKNMVEVASVGRPFFANGQQMVYGYLAPKAPKAEPVVEADEDPEVTAEMMAERAIEMQEAGFDMSSVDF